MDRQLKLTQIYDELIESQTSKKIFLEKIEKIIPWDEWLGIIKPCYYKGERGNKSYDLELMLRIYILQNLYGLSDMKVTIEVIDKRVFSEFCRVDSPRQIPDGGCRKVSGNSYGKRNTEKTIFTGRGNIGTRRIKETPYKNHTLQFVCTLQNILCNNSI